MKKNENNKINITIGVQIHNDNEAEESKIKNYLYLYAHDEYTYFNDITYYESTRTYSIKGLTYATQLGKFVWNMQEQRSTIFIESVSFMMGKK